MIVDRELCKSWKDDKHNYQLKKNNNVYKRYFVKESYNKLTIDGIQRVRTAYCQGSGDCEIYNPHYLHTPTTFYRRAYMLKEK